MHLPDGMIWHLLLGSSSTWQEFHKAFSADTSMGDGTYELTYAQKQPDQIVALQAFREAKDCTMDSSTRCIPMAVLACLSPILMVRVQ